MHQQQKNCRDRNCFTSLLRIKSREQLIELSLFLAVVVERLIMHLGTCSNCKRRGVEISPFIAALVKKRNRKKFYCIPPVDGNIDLCRCCSGYLLNKKNVYGQYWPSMIYKFLQNHVEDEDEDIVRKTFAEKWRLLPSSWRGWWEFEFRNELSVLPG